MPEAEVPTVDDTTVLMSSPGSLLIYSGGSKTPSIEGSTESCSLSSWLLVRDAVKLLVPASQLTNGKMPGNYLPWMSASVTACNSFELCGSCGARGVVAATAGSHSLTPASAAPQICLVIAMKCISDASDAIND